MVTQQNQIVALGWGNGSTRPFGLAHHELSASILRRPVSEDSLLQSLSCGLSPPGPLLPSPFDGVGQDAREFPHMAGFNEGPFFSAFQLQTSSFKLQASNGRPS